MRRFIAGALVAAVIGAWALPGPAEADRGRGRGRGRGGQASHSAGISRDEAASIVRHRFGGRVLSVKGGRGTWRVKLLNRAGDVYTVILDRRSGEVIPPED